MAYKSNISEKKSLYKQGSTILQRRCYVPKWNMNAVETSNGADPTIANPIKPNSRTLPKMGGNSSNNAKLLPVDAPNLSSNNSIGSGHILWTDYDELVGS